MNLTAQQVRNATTVSGPQIRAAVGFGAYELIEEAALAYAHLLEAQAEGKVVIIHKGEDGKWSPQDIGRVGEVLHTRFRGQGCYCEDVLDVLAGGERLRSHPDFVAGMERVRRSGETLTGGEQ